VRVAIFSLILVYTDDMDAPAKAERSLALWQEHRSGGLAVISIQVLQEYFYSSAGVKSCLLHVKPNQELAIQQ